jgi:hypothetical protein
MPSESFLREGTLYLELEGDRAVRQVDAYGGQWFSSRKLSHDEIGIGLTDLPYETSPAWPETEITRDEFERAWDTAGRQGR